MNKKQLQQLLDKYYQAETNLDEEEILRKEILKDDYFREENDLFSLFNEEAFVPEDLEENICQYIHTNSRPVKKPKQRVLKTISIAAMLAILVSIFLLKPQKNPASHLSQNEQFMILEQALSHVSNELQPEEDDPSLIIFEDANLEIVMN